MSQLSIAAIIR